MDSSKKYDNVSPETRANPLSKLLFCWILPFFKVGYSNDLDTKNLFNALDSDLSEPLGNILEKNWNKELKRAEDSRHEPELSRAIKATFLKPFSFYGLALFVQCIILRMVHPLLLAELINYFDPSTEYTPWQGWLLGVSVVAIAFLNTLIMHHVTLGTQRIGMRCRIAACSLIYRKLLKLNKTSLGQTASGQVINLLSNDVARFDMAPSFLHYLWIMPIQAIVAGFIMYRSVGYAAITGLVAISIQAVPVQGYLASLQGKMRNKIAQRTDYRVRLMSEIMSGIQVIKMYAWEKPFEKIVEVARKLEIDIVMKTSYIRGFSLALMVFTERFTLYLTVITYVLDGNRLTGDKVFSVAQFFNTIQLYMAIFYPIAVALLAEANVSIKRLQEFLLLPENTKQAHVNTMPDPNKTGLVKLVKAQASWIAKPIMDTLNNVSLEIKPGTLCAVVGTVGSGKSSLLQLLLKELPLKSGKIDIIGNVSYASQEPWLFVSSVRNNILFGMEYKKNRYKDIVEVCALETDFAQLSHGDKTFVGERGASLSGGQRARINMARAVYREADIYLFDDPLSAVDTHVGKHLFQKCIAGYLDGKTRILVTHQLQFLKQVDVIVIMNNGAIEKIGTYAELSDSYLAHLKQDSNPDTPEHNVEKVELKTQRSRLMSLTSVTTTNTTDDEEIDEPEETQELMETGALSASLYTQYFKAGAGIGLLLFFLIALIAAQAASNGSDLWVTYWTNNEEHRYNRELAGMANDSANPLSNNNTRLISDLTNNNSSLDDTLDFTSTTENWLPTDISPSTSSPLDSSSANSPLNLLPTPEYLISDSSTEFPDNSSAFDAVEKNSQTNPSQEDPPQENPSQENPSQENPSQETPFQGNSSRKHHPIYEDTDLPSQSTYIWIYTSFILASILLTTLRSLLFFKICMNASKNLHNSMFSNVLQATMRFFDTNPSGRILNRFSKDMGAIDEALPKAMMEAIQIFMVMCGILIMVFIVTPWMILPTLVLGGLFYFIRIIYLASAQDLKRLEGITRAPVFSHISASFSGLTTIRVCGAQSLISKEFDTLQDQHTGSWVLFLATSEAFGFYLDVLSIIFLAIVTFQFLIFKDENTLSGDVGLVISQSLILTGMLQYGMRQTAEVSSQMTSVERVLQYTKLDKEGPFESEPTKKPHRDWPQNGAITFEKTSLRYTPLDPPVLHDLNFGIKPGEKIGIVGRTGAGKSSIISALFRLAPTDGVISIDNVDTKTIGLNDLRSNISIIPQEPVLFSASLRSNLDPFERSDDESLWKALDNVELKDSVDTLDQTVTEGGTNFSAGQRQLICLARAILRNNKILVMDEATANVDPQTDGLIQATLRKNFKNCTVLTIAHRLNTVMDSDKILVMDGGQMVEFGHPHELLQRRGGFFSKMVEQTGRNMEGKLRKVALEAFKGALENFEVIGERVGGYKGVVGDGRIGDGRIGDVKIGDVRIGDVRIGDGRIGDGRIGDGQKEDGKIEAKVKEGTPKKAPRRLSSNKQTNNEDNIDQTKLVDKDTKQSTNHVDVDETLENDENIIAKETEAAKHDQK